MAGFEWYPLRRPEIGNILGFEFHEYQCEVYSVERLRWFGAFGWA
jgi:hypothetical protein